MATTTETFITSFHSLEGVTIGERRKNLFCLLKQFQSSNREINFTSLCPRTPLEESFKLEALMRFRRTPELVKILSSEKPALLKKILKMNWFILEAFKNAEDLLLIFSNISYNVKVKLLNRLAVCLRDFQRGDSLFSAIRKQYGLYLALKLLPACSENRILEFFGNCCKQICSRQVLIILRHRPELAESIFNALSCKDRSRVATVYRVVFIYIGRRTHSAFINLYRKYQLYFCLGKRATRKLILANRELIIADARDLFKMLHKAQVIKTLKDDFQHYYVKLFPTSVDNFSHSFSFLNDIVSKVPPVQRLALIEESFKRTYGYNVWHNTNWVTLDLLNLATPLTHTSLQFKPHFLSPDRWTCYFPTEQSIPLLKKRISLSADVSTRLTLVSYLVETCKVHNDKKALADVCRYFIKQHRNDHISVRSRFLTMIKTMFDLEHLEEDHWGCINELLEIFDMNHETFTLDNVFQLRHIQYRFFKGLSIDDYLTQYIMQENSWYFLKNSAEFEKHCLLLLGEILPCVLNADSVKYLQFLACLVDWNRRHPNDIISLFKYKKAVDVFTASLGENANVNLTHEIVQYLLQIESDTDLANLCISKMRDCNWRILRKLLRDKLLLVLHNVDTLTKLTLRKPSIAFWRYCRNYAHLEIPQRIVNTCLSVINGDSRSYRKRNAIICISYLMPAENFLASIATYYPTDGKASSHTIEEQGYYHYQKAYTSALKNVTPTSLALPAMLNFCKGDYLKTILNTLYSISSNVNEHSLHDFLRELSTRPVSVRKHAIHLTLRVLDRPAILNMFNKHVNTEENSSVRKFLLKGSFNLFLQDADDFMWNLVKLNIKAVDREDKEVIDLLMRIEDVPSTYVIQYVLFLWNFLNVTAAKEEYHERKMWELLRFLSPDVVQKLPTEFSNEIIQKYFEKFYNGREKHTFIYSVYNFTCKYIVYCTNQVEQEQRMNLVFLFLKRFLCEDHVRYLVEDFLKIFCGEFLIRKFREKLVLITFISLWDSYMELDAGLDQYVYLQLTLLFVDSVIDSLSMDDVGKRIAQLGFWLCSKYSNCAVFILCDLLKSFCRHFIADGGCDNDRYALINGIINNCASNSILIVAIVLLKCNIKNNSPIKCKHDDIIEKLKNVPDPIIKIYLNHYLHRMNI